MSSDRFDRKQFFAALGIVLLATVVASLATRQLAFLANLENIAADIRIAALQPPAAQSPDVAIISINEETLTRFRYRSPIDREFLAQLLSELDRKGARAIGLDVLLDQPTEDRKDDLLARTIRNLKTPLFISYTNTPTIVTEDQLEYLNKFVPESLRAGANLASSPFDGAVRWIFPGENVPGMPMGFARKAVAAAGMTPPAPLQPELVWRAQPDADTPPFPIYPAHAVASLPPAWLKDRILLIGAMVSLTDRHRTPMSVMFDDDRGMMPGIMVQAHAVTQYLENRDARRPNLAGQLAVGLAAALLGMGIGLLKRGIVFNVLAGVGVLLVLWVGGMLGYTHGLPLIPLMMPSLALSLSLWGMDMLIGRAERQQRQFVQGAFSRYVAPAVVEQLVNDPSALTITGKRQDATFIFTDIAGFTTMSEKLPSDELSNVLNAYLDGACAVVQRYEGTVDKFIGDAVMAIFNAPLPQPDHVSRAVRCALDLDAYCEDFRIKMNAQGVPIGETRIGVHTGVATIGNFGSQHRMDFTALGDTVNTAARTEGVNKYFGTRICCTEAVAVQCGDVRFRPIGDIVLKGKLTPVTLFNPVTAEMAASEHFKRYMDAYNALKQEDQGAVNLFEKMGQDYPQDPLVQFHLSRIHEGVVSTLVVMEEK